MGIVETGIVYGIIGVVVAAAMALREPGGALTGRLLAGASRILFWPLFAPVLLAAAAQAGTPPSDSTPVPDPRLQAAGTELVRALTNLDQLTGGVLRSEIERARGLMDSLAASGRRLSEMDALTRTPELDAGRAEALLADLERRGTPPDDPRVKSVAARLRNIRQLREMRDRGRDQLERALLKMEEMSSQLRLLQFTSNADGELGDLIHEIAASVEGIAEGLAASA